MKPILQSSLIQSHHHLHYTDVTDFRGITRKNKRIIQFERDQDPDSPKWQNEEGKA